MLYEHTQVSFPALMDTVTSQYIDIISTVDDQHVTSSYPPPPQTHLGSSQTT